MPTIKIRASQRVTYVQEIEISEESLKELFETPGKQMECESMSPLGDFIDFHDCDGGRFDDIEIEEIDGAKRVWNPED